MNSQGEHSGWDRDHGAAVTDHNATFESFLRSNGATDEFVGKLTELGFTSKLALSYLDPKGEAYRHISSSLNVGQQCLLLALIELCQGSRLPPSDTSTPPSSLYRKGVNLAVGARVTGAKKRDELQSLFPQLAGGRKRQHLIDLTNEESENNSSNEFEFVPLRKKGVKANPARGKERKKRKKPTYVFNVVILPAFRSSTPIRSEREKLVKTIWVEQEATADQVLALLKHELSLKGTPMFMLAKGRSLRTASLDDVNSNSWDAKALRQLKGDGFLYLVDNGGASAESIPAQPKPSTIEQEVSQLRDMFPWHQPEYIRRLVVELGVNSAAELLLLGDSMSKASPGSVTAGTTTVTTVTVSSSLSSVPPSQHSSHSMNLSLSRQSRPTSRVVYASLLSSNRNASMFRSVDNEDNPGVEHDDHFQSVTPSTEGLPDNPTLKQVIRHHARRVVQEHSSEELSLDRDHLWKQCLGFYSKCIDNTAKLQVQLQVEFKDEQGTDLGGIRAEFFTLLMKEIDSRCFEGNACRRVPKSDPDLYQIFELAGVMIGHSVLQGGPSLPCLSPSIYAHLISGEVNPSGDFEDFPSKDDIPLNAATSCLLEFIEKMDRADTDEDIDNLLDNIEYITLVNSSGWPAERPINLATKPYLLQNLVIAEVIMKRIGNLKQFRRGLEKLGFLRLVQLYPRVCRPLFVFDPNCQTLTGERFKKLIVSCEPKQEKEKQAYHFLMQYIDAQKSGVSQLLMFITGYKELPPLGLPYMISLGYLPNMQRYCLPQASTCFSSLSLPVCHVTFEDFSRAFDAALSCGSAGFGLF